MTDKLELAAIRIVAGCVHRRVQGACVPCIQVALEQVEARVAALEGALAEAHAIIQSDEVMGMEAVAWVHGARYSEAFIQRSREASQRRAALLQPAPAAGGA